MCGIAGVISNHPRPRGELSHLAGTMAGALEHRGPDAAGRWVDDMGRCALGHSRLSILDLSPAANQPMTSACGGWTISCNGEIYNFAELRTELEKEGAAFRTTSDTEVLLEACARWGPDAAVSRCVGMFAFALHDHRGNKVHLFRDRIGEKPLYYGRAGGDFIFASELKAFFLHPDWDDAVDPRAVEDFLHLNFVPAPRSIYRHARKLPAAHSLVVDLSEPLATPKPCYYWRLEDFDEEAISYHDALDGLHERLQRAVRLQTVADVPVGAFLSGGVDSSLIIALMQEAGGTARTFTIGFDHPAYDESPDAAAIAGRLDTEHHEFRCTEHQAMALVPELPRIYDEPFADSSQLPTLLVCRAARDLVTVALTGDGGDENFAGYNRHHYAHTFSRHLARLPLPIRRLMGSAIRQRATKDLSRLADCLIGGGGPSAGTRIGDLLHKVSITLPSRDIDGLYDSLVGQWGHPPAQGRNGFHGGARRVMERDALRYLPDDILVKVDRAAMSVGLETRAPFLDHRVVEFSRRIPVSHHLAHGGKSLTRDLLGRFLPRSVFERPKTGFGPPVGEWLRGPLRDWAEATLAACDLPVDRPSRAEISDCWEEHLAGRRNHFYRLWSLLVWSTWQKG